MSTQTTRIQIIVPVWLKSEMQRMAKLRGISMSEYLKDLAKFDIEFNRRNGVESA